MHLTRAFIPKISLSFVVFQIIFICYGFADFYFPKPTGKYSVGTVSYVWEDKTRLEEFALTEESETKYSQENWRKLIVQIWYPAENSSFDKRKQLHINGHPKKLDHECHMYLEKEMPYLKKMVKQKYYFPSFVLNYLFTKIYTHALPDKLVALEKSQYPVVLFSHGFCAMCGLYTGYLEELASHGYIVVGINHTYDSSISVFSDSDVILYNKEYGGSQYNYIQRRINTWIEDVRFVLDKLEDLQKSDPYDILTDRLDLDRIGMFGHSMGGATTTQICRLDDRVKAGINIDGPLLGEHPTKRFEKPYMVILGEESLNRLSMPIPDYELQNRQLSEDDARSLKITHRLYNPLLCASLGKDAYYLELKGADHRTFCDLALIQNVSYLSSMLFCSFNTEIGSIDPRRALNIVNDYVVNFFKKYLKGECSRLLDDKQSQVYPEILLKAW